MSQAPACMRAASDGTLAGHGVGGELHYLCKHALAAKFNRGAELRAPWRCVWCGGVFGR
jgi:hypothetical protein